MSNVSRAPLLNDKLCNANEAHCGADICEVRRSCSSSVKFFKGLPKKYDWRHRVITDPLAHTSAYQMEAKAKQACYTDSNSEVKYDTPIMRSMLERMSNFQMVVPHTLCPKAKAPVLLSNSADKSLHRSCYGLKQIGIRCLSLSKLVLSTAAQILAIPWWLREKQR